MANTNSDGRVVIDIKDNAFQVAKNLGKLQDSFATLANDTSKYERILAKVEGTSKANLPIYEKIRQKLEEQKAASRQAYEELRKMADVSKSGLGFNQLGNLTQTVTDRLSNLALQGRENTVEFKNLANVLKNSNEKLQNAENAVQKAIGGTKGLTVAGIELSTVIKGISFVAITRELYQYGQQALKTAAEFEQLEVSFNIMAGGAAQGEKLTESLINLANKTPMTTEGLARATQTLLSFGESSDNIIKDLQLLGDISGGQEQRFQSLALAFAQVGSTGRLTGQDLLQMVNQGFNPLEVISKKTGKSMAQLKKEMGEGKISFDMVKQAMIDTTSEGGRFYGLMNEQSGTLNGLLSTNSDTWQRVSKNIGDGFMPVAKEAVRVLIALGNSILKLQEKMTDFQKSFNYKTVESATKRYEGTLKESQYYNNLAAKEEKRAANARGAGRREAILSRVESYKKRAQSLQESAKKYKLAIEEIKKAEAEANKPSGSTGFSSGGSTLSGSASAEKIKDAFEKAQEKAQEAEKAFKLALYKYGEGSNEVEKARLKWVDTKKAVDEVQKAYEKLTATGKTPFEQLNFNLQEAQNKLRNLASADIIDLEKVKQAQTEVQKWQTKLDSVNQYFNMPKGHLEELNLKIQETQKLLGELYFTKGVNSEEFKKAKNELVQLQTTAKNVNTAITSQIGVDWSNISESIKSNLSSAILTPLQEGESAFERLGNVAFSIIQAIGQELTSALVVEPLVNNITGALKNMGNTAQPIQQVSQSLLNTGTAATQTAAATTAMATGQTAVSAIMATTSSAIAGAAASYGAAAVSAQQLAASITQAAVAQAAYSAALVPIAGAALAPLAATATGAAIAAGNIMATGSTLLSKINALADGGVIKGGNVIPFAKGGVVNKPTIFPMANGGTGLMGEAGAEAVMPLRRMSNGRLGVEAENNNGQAVQVNIYNQSGASVETRKRDDGSMDIFIRKVNEALSSERTSSGFRSAYAREDRKGVQAV